MNRREFIGAMTGLAVTGGIPAGTGSFGEPPAFVDMTNDSGMIYRSFGKTTERISAIGLGGFHIGFQSDAQESMRIIRFAIDHGITFMDNCWDYNKGESERRMGQALRDGYRQRVFLMTKYDGRTKEAAAKQIDESGATSFMCAYTKAVGRVRR